jgi:hypothetical protein
MPGLPFDGEPGPVGHDDLVGLDAPTIDPQHKCLPVLRQGADTAAQLDRELETRRLTLEICDDLVACRVAIRLAVEAHSWEAVIAPWREQDEGIPALVPRSADDVGAVEDRESAAPASQEIADGKARLARADYRNLEAFWITVA